MQILFWLASLIATFWGPAKGAIANYLNLRELGKVVVLSLAMGAGIGGTVTAVKNDLPNIIRDPVAAGAAATAATGLVETWRRLKQGKPVAAALPTPPVPGKSLPQALRVRRPEDN